MSPSTYIRIILSKVTLTVILSKPVHKKSYLEWKLTQSFCLKESHVPAIYGKSWQNIHALSRIINCTDFEKRKYLMKIFIATQLSYCSLIWMFYSSILNIATSNLMNEPWHLFTRTTNYVIEIWNSEQLHFFKRKIIFLRPLWNKFETTCILNWAYLLPDK